MTTDGASLKDEENLRTAEDELNSFLSQLILEYNLSKQDMVWLLEKVAMNLHRQTVSLIDKIPRQIVD